MKIIHIILSKGFSGSEKYVIDLINEQSKKHKCYLLKNRKNKFQNFYQDLNKEVKIIEIDSFFSILTINFFINLIKPNIVHTHLGQANRKVFKRNFFKLISTVHMNFKKKDFKNHDGLIVSNNSLKKEINQNFHKKIKKIYLWPSANNKIKIDSNELKNKYNITPKSYIFGSIGRFHYQKGFDFIIEAFKKIEEKNIFLFLIGNGHEDFKRYSNKNLIILPYQKNTSDYYNLFDCFIMASRWESFGITLLEAMKFGLPIISSKHQGNQDWLENFDVDIFDINKLDSLTALMKKKYSYGKIKVNYNLDQFDKNKIIKEIENFYKEV